MNAPETPHTLTPPTTRRRVRLALLGAITMGPVVWFLTSALMVFDGRSLLDHVAIRLPVFLVSGACWGWFASGRVGERRAQPTT